MFSIIRSGPKILILESCYIHEVINYFKNHFDAFQCNMDTAFEKSNEDNIVILLTEKMKDLLNLTDIKNILVLKGEVETVLSHILNNKKYDFISCSRIAPRIIIMRYFGDIEKVVNEVKEDYNGHIGTFDEILEKNNKGTVIAFTKNPLNHPISLSNIYEKSLLIHGNYSTLMKDLRIHDLKYLNIGLDNKDWYELHIKIYDSYGEYALHYERLVHIMENLQLGLILGESWGTDAATIFYSVGIYRIRFFTFYEPSYIKKMLLGLEYLDDGTRIVDLDLYHKRRKFYWSDLKNREKKDKISLSKIYREKILSTLEKDSLEELFALEKKILNTRY
ncbi:hypothetical protein [Crassaminicella profunda]|uniref:hypothetical protein n=1 Tax=Crassaminicella profunda TaxID=1286698 RepID=UPI001CA7A63E|nr:hypothetical protein [Crassaminicella profunda]QZY56375.1 hypothetical protein K7H06_05470 [Crassaminicella profunda]